MKLSKSLTSCNHEKRHYGRLIFNLSRILIIPAILLFISACEEKIPTIQNPGQYYDFNTLTIPADSMIFRQAEIEPTLGQSLALYVGNDENIYAYTIIKFDEIDYYLPDSVDKFISLTLNLRNDHQYCLDGSESKEVDINIYHLLNGGTDPWSEDTTNVDNFDINNSSYTLDLLSAFHYTDSDTDTVTVEMDTTLISQWLYSTNEDYSVVLAQADTSILAIQAFYSVESSYYPWLEVNYIYDGDTLTAKILPTEDLSILKFKKSVDTTNRMTINSGRGYFSILTFNFENLLTDRNEYIAKAELHLASDPENTERYGEIFYLYVNLADSSLIDTLGNPYASYDPNDQSYDYLQSISSDDSVVVNVKALLQGVASNYITNYGLVLYSKPTTSNISTLSLYNSSSDNPDSFRPYLRILTMKEL